MYVVYVWTGGWLISLVLVTSDNKGLLLLLLICPCYIVITYVGRKFKIGTLKEFQGQLQARLPNCSYELDRDLGKV